MRLVAARTSSGLHVRVAEFGKCCLVDLHIDAAGCGERAQLALERRNDIVPELVHVAVAVCRYGGITTAEMQRAGPWNGDLRQRAGARAHEREIVRMDRASPGNA